MKTDLDNIKRIFETEDLFKDLNKDTTMSRIKDKFRVGGIIRFPKSGIVQEILIAAPDRLVTTIVEGRGIGMVGSITWGHLRTLLRQNVVESVNEDFFKGPSEDDLKKLGVDPIVQKYKKWALKSGLRPMVADAFGKYMTKLWGDRQLRYSYGEEWMERFRNGSACIKADDDGRKILRELGIKQGRDASGNMIDIYSVEEASKYRISLSPEDLPYTYDDIIALPEYQALIDIPYIRDATTQAQKNHRTVFFIFNGSNLNVSEDFFTGLSADDVKKKKDEDLARRRDIAHVKAMRVRTRLLHGDLGNHMYSTYANGYIRTAGFSQGVIAKLKPALHLDDYKKLLVRLKQTIDRRIKSIKKLNLSAQEYGITEDFFKGSSEDEIAIKKDAYRKTIKAESNAWKDIAKRELEITLECQFEIDIEPNNTEVMTLTIINDTEWNNGDGKWTVYQNEDVLDYIATEKVKQQLEEDPSMFSQSFLEDYILLYETDRRMIAQEEAENLMDGMSADDILSESDMTEEFEELQNQIDALYDLEEGDPEEEDVADELVTLSDKQEDILNLAKEKWSEKTYNEIYIELDDPVEYFVNTHGFYDMNSLLQASFIHIDIDDAANDAVHQDGPTHALGHFGEEINLHCGAVAYGE